MDFSSASHAVPSDVDALATLLGVKGPLRLVPQGPTPKAHIILRRDFSRDSEMSDGETSNIARFSFVAGKKITVNKGQPLLFAVASPKDRDGKILLGKDNTFVLEGTIDENPYQSDEEEVDRIKRKKMLRKMQQGTKSTALPPKMRKSFGGKTTYESFAESYLQHKPASSLGFGGYPLANEKTRVFATTEVQTDPIPSVLSPIEESVAPRVSGTVEEANKSPVQLPSPVSADHGREVISGSIANAESEEVDEYSRMERSLSPMDLSSASSSPPASPTFKSQPLPETNIVATPNAPDDISSNALNADLLPVPEAQALGQIDPALQDVPSSPLSSPPADRSLTIEQSTESENKPSEAAKPKSPPPAQIPIRVSTPPLQSVHNASAILAVANRSDDIEGRITNPKSTSPQVVQQDLIIKKELVLQSEQMVENAVASSSKSPGQDMTEITNGLVAVRDSQQPTRLVGHLSARAQEKLPVLNPTPKQPAAPSTSRMASNASVPRSSSPPPDPKELVYIPSGSSSNPLGIRPSSGRPVPVPPGSFKPSKPVPIGPRSLIANGWGTVPTKRQWSTAKGSDSSSNTPNSVISTIPSSPVVPAPSVSTLSNNKASLSQIMRYVSPSPPPPPSEAAPPPPPPPIAIGFSQSSNDTSRWKRISPVEEKKTGFVKETTRPADDTVTSTRVAVDDKKEVLSRSSSASSSASLKRSLDSIPSFRDDSNTKEVPVGEHPSKKARTMMPLHPLTPTFVRATVTANSSASTPSTPAPPPTVPAAQSPPHNPPAVAAAPSTSASAPVVTQKALPLTHPLPPKPVVAVSSSSYRPPAKRDRERERERERSLETIEPKRTPVPRTDWPPTNCSADYQLQPHGTNTDLSIQKITISSDGSLIALTCADRTLRIWENKPLAIEIARLSHNSALASVCWMDGASGVMTLTVDGTISTWTRNGKEWRFTKLLSVPVTSSMSNTEMICLAYVKDRIAVATNSSVNVWLLINGTWKQQREIKRSGVSVVQFIQDGAAIVGGCRDGAIWICEVPNGTLRAHSFFPKPITSIDVHPSGSYLLVAVEGGQAHLLTMKESMGTVEHTYTSEKVQNQAAKQKGFPAVFATRGQAILYGTVNGCALVWDRKKCQIVYGLKHPEGDRVLAAATFDGRPGVEGLMITGTKQGRLFWWPQPVAAAASK